MWRRHESSEVRRTVALPKEAVGSVIGRKGAKIQSIQDQCDLSICRVVQANGQSELHLRGSSDGVEKAAALVEAFVAKFISHAGRAVGYVPTFSLLVYVPSVTAPSDVFACVPAGPTLQAAIDQIIDARALPSYTLAGPSDAQWSPNDLQAKAKTSAIRLDDDDIATYLGSVYEVVQTTGESDQVSFNVSCGKTVFQMTPDFAETWRGPLTASTVVHLQRRVRHQFCSTVLTDAAMDRVREWAMTHGFALEPEPIDLAVVTVVRLGDKTKVQWTVRGEDVASATFVAKRTRLGFVSFVHMHPTDVGYRLEVHAHQQHAGDLPLDDLQASLSGAYAARDADGFLELPPENAFQVDYAKYSQQHWWARGDVVLQLNRWTICKAEDRSSVDSTWEVKVVDARLNAGGQGKAAFVARTKELLALGKELAERINASGD